MLLYVETRLISRGDGTDDRLVECAGCQIHNLNCENGQARLHGFGEDGFFAEYALVDYHNVSQTMQTAGLC